MFAYGIGCEAFWFCDEEVDWLRASKGFMSLAACAYATCVD